MTWMLTATGATVNLEWVAASSISLLDIAHHLAQINRFTGACSRPYSVAEHSLLVVEIMERDLAIRSPHALLAGLLHDAHEAYTQDLSTPLKRVLGPEWARTEGRIANAVRERFNVSAARAGAWDDIHRADLIALATERAQLLPPGGPEWASLDGHPPVTWVRLADRAGMGWADWRQAFIDKFAELNYARNLQMQCAIGTEPAPLYEGPHA
jgi:hypothetical protein